MSLALELAKQAFIFVVEKMTNLFQNRNGIGHFLGVLPQLDELIKLLVDIGEVEISGHYQISTHPVVLAKKRVAVLDAVFAKGAVAKMPH